jgi:hypothetical protein
VLLGLTQGGDIYFVLMIRCLSNKADLLEVCIGMIVSRSKQLLDDKSYQPSGQSHERPLELRIDSEKAVAEILRLKVIACLIPFVAFLAQLNLARPPCATSILTRLHSENSTQRRRSR